MPMLTEGWRVWLPICTGKLTALKIFSAVIIIFFPERTSFIKIKNSSPPNLAATSSARTEAAKREATTFSSASPTVWPSRSLTFLKRSISKNITANLRLCRLDSSRVWLNRRENSCLFGKPVSESCKACCVMVFSASLRSVTSRMLAIIPLTLGSSSLFMPLASSQCQEPSLWR